MRTGSARWLLRSTRQDPHDLLVWHLPEVLVPERDRKQLLGLKEAHYLIDLATQNREDVWRGDRGRENELGRAAHLHGADRGAHRPTGGDAVVDQDHDPPAQVWRGPPAAKPFDAAAHLVHLATRDCEDVRPTDTKLANNRTIEDHRRTLRDRAHSELGLERRTELANDPDVESSTEYASHLIGHGDATAWQAEDDRIHAGVMDQCLPERATRRTTVGEHPRPSSELRGQDGYSRHAPSPCNSEAFASR